MSTPISFSASSISTYVPKVTKILDPVKSGGLAVAELPDSDGEDISTGLVYSAAGLTVNGAVPTGKAVYLKDKEGNFFTLDTEDVRLVASGTNLNLYVYTPEDEEGTRLSADKYVFNLNGVLQSDEPENVSAQAMSKVEFDARRDLNGDGSIGAFMFKTAATDDVDGQLDAEGSLYRVNIGHALEDNAPVGGRSFYVVGAEVAKAKTLNISSSTLLTSDGLVWAPPELDDGAEYKSLRAFATSSKEAGKIVTTWAVYATDQDDQITEFKFDKSLKLIDDETRVLTANDLATLEKQYKRDLNNDSFFGVEVTGTLDDKTGLYKGSILGKEFYLVGSKLQSGTAAAPTSLAGALLDGQGDPWALPEDYTIATMIKNPASDVATRGAYSVFAYASDDDTHKTVVRFDFKAQIVDGTDTPTGNFIVELADGEQVTAADLAKAEKSAKRDLNADGVFGVKVDQELDKVGGLYRASALGNDFIIVGKALTSTSSKPLDLSTALLNSEGEAWAPEGVTDLTNNVRIVTKSGVSAGYEVYVKEDKSEDSDEQIFARYTFGNDFVQVGDREEISLNDLATAEKAYKRDLNGDSAFGVVVKAMIDSKAGLYSGEFESEKKIYLKVDSPKLGIGSKVAANGIDLSAALMTDDGLWDVDSGYKVQSAYVTEEENYVVIATATTDNVENPNDIRKYTFTKNNDGVMVFDAAKSGDMDLFELTKLEGGAEKRDLNRDGQIGVKVKTTDTLDKVGGLQQITLGTGETAKTFLLAGKASEIKDLSTALLDGEGAAWQIAEGETAAALVKSGGDYLLFTKNDDDQYIRHTFKTNPDDQTIRYDDSDSDNSKVLNLIDLSDDEHTYARDINADKAAGAKISAVLDKVGGLYSASIGGETMYLVSDTAPGKTTKLGNKALLESEGVAWAPNGDYKLTAVVKNGSNGYSVYAINKGDNNDVVRYTFDSGRILSDSESLSAEDLIDAEISSKVGSNGRDLNQDKAVGAIVTGVVDKKGALYQVGLLGSSYYVVGTVGSVLKTDKTGAAPVDLSKALLDSEGAAWVPEEGWEVGGLVTETEGGITSYHVYTYKKDGDDIAEVQQSTWNLTPAGLEFMGENDADVVALVNVEATQKRDLSGDKVVGFRKVDTLEDGYAGVTESTVLKGATTFLIAGANRRAGTPSAPLSLKDALLTADGAAAWRPLNDGEKVKAVDDVDANTRYVYTKDADQVVRRYTFDRQGNSAGQLKGDFDLVTAVALSQVEKSRKKDLDNSGTIAITAQDVTTQDYTVDGATKLVGLISVESLGSSYLVVGAKPGAGKNIDLSAALLNADGSAWAAPEGVLLRGVYQPEGGNTEIYGIEDDGDKKIIKRFEFEEQSDKTLKLVGSNENNPGGSAVVSGVSIAAREGTAKKDLNGDGSIGFKVTDSKVIGQSNGFNLGRAAINTPEIVDDGDEIDSPEIFIVGTALNKKGSVASNLANSAALFDGSAYWALADGEKIKSLVQTADAEGKPNKVSLYTKKDSVDDDGDLYVRYEFTPQGDDKLWTLSTAEGLTSAEMLEEEVLTKRDLNIDEAVGLSADITAVSGLTVASIDDKSYFLVGALTSGTSLRPLSLSGTSGGQYLLRNSDDTAWKPEDGVTIEAFSVLSPSDGDAKYKLTLSNNLEVNFDASYKLLPSAEAE